MKAFKTGGGERQDRQEEDLEEERLSTGLRLICDASEMFSKTRGVDENGRRKDPLSVFEGFVHESGSESEKRGRGERALKGRFASAAFVEALP